MFQTLRHTNFSARSANPTSSTIASKVEKEEFMSSLKIGKSPGNKLMPNDYQTRSTTNNGNKV